MTTHNVHVDLTLEVTDELAVREHAFRLLRQRMEAGPGADAMVEQLTDNLDFTLRTLVSWQLVAGEGLKGVEGLRLVKTEVPPA